MIESFKKYYNELNALIIKELRLKLRYKFKLLFALIIPILAFIIPYLIFQKIFKIIGDKSFGIWTPQNYIIFLLTGIFVSLILEFIGTYGKTFLQEKYYKTLSGLFLAPMNISSIYLSKLLIELLIYAPHLILIFTICFLIAESSLLSIFFVIIIFFSACILLSAIGLAIGSFRISLEGNYTILYIIIKVFFIFSCYKYPKEVFPQYLYIFIAISPFYYYWDLIRYILVFDISYVLFNPNFTIHFIVIITATISAPILSLYFFNYVFKKYGISGY
ncbi:MAG: ABC transporter permease [Promethearchaeota archaeon]